MGGYLLQGLAQGQTDDAGANNENGIHDEDGSARA
jgi:hypothetical protein